MSSLSAKVKDLLSRGDSSKDETAQHAPGAFPTEDMEPSETREGYSKGHEHNKLHKANDPRGFAEGGSNAPQGHAYKDSGVGLTESHGPTSTSKPAQEPISERHNESLDRTTDSTTGGLGASTARLGAGSNLASRESTNLPSQGTNPSSQEHSTGTGGLGTSTAGLGAGAGAGASGLGAGNNLAARESTNLPSQGTDPSSQQGVTGTSAPSTEDHPYWGDLPHGAGTGAGVHNTVIGRGSAEDEAQRHRAVHSGATEPTRTSGTLESGTFLHRNDRDESSINTNPHDSQTYAQQNPNDQTSGSRFKEGVAGAGAAGGAALGAHELSKRHHEETPRDQTTDKTQHEKHEGRSFPLLGKDHKDTHKDSHHKEDKHDKHAHEPKKEHESKLGALFHRNKDDKEPTEQEHSKDKHHSKAAPLAAAGAGGAYAATRGHDDGTHRDTTSQYQNPSATQGTTQYPASGLDSTKDYTQSSHPTQQPHGQDDSHRGAGLATGAAAGLGAGALASHHGHRSGDDRAGHQPTSGYESQSYDPTKRSTQDPTLQTSQGTHQGHGLGAGTAAGLGAGALGSHSGHHSSSAQPSGLESSQGSQPANFSHRDPTGQSFQQEDSHRGAGLAAGTAAGLGAGALASHSGRDHQSGTSGLESNRGLDSNRGLESQTGYPSSTTQNPTQSHDHHDSHRGAGLATGTAAGLGAGALASHSGRDHQSGTSGLDSNRGLDSQTNYPSGTTQDPTHSHDSHRGTGLTAATVAGLGSGHHGSDQHSGLESNRGIESQGTHHSSRDPTSQSYQPEDSHRGTGLATGAAAGLGAGALASHSGRDHHSGEHTGLESNRGLQSQGLSSTERSTRDPTSHSHQEGSHGGSGLASGTAAGLGAGALASHEANKHHGSDQYGAGDNSRGLQSGLTGTGDSSRGPQSGLTGTSSGLGNNSSRNEPLTGSHSQSHEGHHHTLTDNANRGKYNTLASGTPSGVAYDDDDTSSSSQRAPVDTTQSKDSHFGSKAAGLGAAAAGAGTAGVLSHNRDQKQTGDLTRQTEPQTERGLDRQTETHKPITGAVAPGMSSSSNKPVIHKCKNCGEDNDISEYFTSKLPGRN
ncbi:uncharacterized protein FTOL_03603 [Fusarium torulosum]|uniref:Uncharacterized protein n=1 Tax=Fusarium torulosum TaxID=33205 RepID=A0AAE8SFE3_9HYPO|nr:uncharacterized protein FTOL_03603 [Fusarium torulosum]